MAMGQPQSFVSKIETGERGVHIDDLEPLAAALQCNPTTILNHIAGLDSVLDRWELSESEFTELIDSNPSLRGMVFGYAAEVKFRRIFLADRPDITSVKDDDHDRKKKGDRRLQYNGREIVVEVKSLQTKTVEYDADRQLWTGGAQVDGSDRRVVTFDDGSTLNTTLLLRGQFDILAVNCFSFGNEWKFAFALNKDLATSTYRRYNEEQKANLIASMQYLTWPPAPPFTEDWDEILERAWEARQPEPDVKDVQDAE